jgi:hypothetical protein
MSSVRIAIASSNDVDIDQTLQEAMRFHIYDLTDDIPDCLSFVEIRVDTVRADDMSEEAPIPGTVDWLLAQLWDCSLLLVREITGGIGGKYRLHWITVHEAAMPIDKALRNLASSALFRRELSWTPWPRNQKVVMRKKQIEVTKYIVETGEKFIT